MGTGHVWHCVVFELGMEDSDSERVSGETTTCGDTGLRGRPDVGSCWQYKICNILNSTQNQIPPVSGSQLRARALRLLMPGQGESCGSLAELGERSHARSRSPGKAIGQLVSYHLSARLLTVKQSSSFCVSLEAMTANIVILLNFHDLGHTSLRLHSVGTFNSVISSSCDALCSVTERLQLRALRTLSER